VKKFKFLLVAAALLSSCGGPTFKVAYRYVPPSDEKGRACAERCYRQFEECQSRCRESYEACLAQVRSRAVSVYEKALSLYGEELNAYQKSYSAYQNALLNWNRNYRLLYRDYEYFKRLCKKSKDYSACRRGDELEEALETLNEKKPVPPERPRKPDLQQIVRELSAACSADCGCQRSYEDCFTACGGKVVPEKFCVENCK